MCAYSNLIAVTPSLSTTGQLYLYTFCVLFITTVLNIFIFIIEAGFDRANSAIRNEQASDETMKLDHDRLKDILDAADAVHGIVTLWQHTLTCTDWSCALQAQRKTLFVHIEIMYGLPIGTKCGPPLSEVYPTGILCRLYRRRTVRSAPASLKAKQQVSTGKRGCITCAYRGTTDIHALFVALAAVDNGVSFGR